MSVLLTPDPASSPQPAASKPAALPPRKLTFPERVWGWLACFRSVQLAIILLSLLAAATLAGVLLPQEGLVEAAEIKKQFAGNYRIFKAMGFFNVYSSYWYIALEVLFFFNMLFGSFQWLKPAFLAATTQSYLGPEPIRISSSKLTWPSELSPAHTVSEVKHLLKKNRYTVYEQAETAMTDAERAAGIRKIYACKGNFSRLGASVVHTGILMLLLASVYGAFTGFKAQKLAEPGTTFSIPDSEFFQPNVNAAVWQGSVPDWKVKVNDFRIEYYPEGASPDGNTVVKQYYADLSVLNPDGTERDRQTIYVNHPMQVDDTTIYQASFKPTGKLFVAINGKTSKIDVNTEFQGRSVSFTPLNNGKILVVFPFFVQQDPGVKRNYVVMFLRDSKGFLGAAPGKMPENLRLEEGQAGMLGGLHLGYVKPEISTGLQIKKAPEVPWMYLAFIVFMVGTVMCIFTQRRLWLAVQPGPDGGPPEVLMMYRTNKAKLSFKKELQKLYAALDRQLNPRKNQEAS